jgi:uncharacterized protein YkwD
MALVTHAKKPATHQKKRQGGHHRHSKHYLKAYWPYLPMLLVVYIGFFVSNQWSNKQHVLGTASNLNTTSLLSYTNTERQDNYESRLTLSNNLDSAAQAKAEDMAKNNYWSHISPSGKTPWDFMNAAGYSFRLAGENLAYGFSSAQATISGWMNSPEHRANILGNGYRNVGFGVASSSDYQSNGPETIVVAEYATPTSRADTISFSVPNPPIKITPIKPTEISAQPVSRIQILTNGSAIWSIIFASLSGAAFMYVLIKYGVRFKLAVRKSEAFIISHPLLDILTVAIIMSGFVLTRTGGFVR